MLSLGKVERKEAKSLNAYVNEYRKWVIKNHICIRCYREKAWNGRQMCPECLSKAQECSERTRTKASKEQRKRYLKRKRELCIAFGVCRECLKRKATVGKKCLDCHVKQIKINESRKKKVPRSIRVELNLCYFCGKPAMKEKRVCEEHYKIFAENISKAKHNTINHIWRKIKESEIRYLKYNDKKGKDKNGK